MDAFLHLFASQVVSRALTFGLNLLSARSLTPQAYGVVAIQLHLLNTTLLFLSREGFRRGCLRIDPGRPGAVLGTSALCIPLGSVLSVLAVAALGQRRPGDAAWHTALLLQGVAAVVELAGEPLYILATVQQRYSLRVAAETAAQLAKSATALTLLARAGADPAVVFSWAQLAYAGVLTGGYAAAYASALCTAWNQRYRRRGAGQERKSTVARSLDRRGASLAIDGHALQLSGLFGAQALGKLGLAEGSKFVLAGAASAFDQGVMGLVTNLGSLVVRTVFQPYEEATFYAFSAASVERESGQDKKTGDGGTGGRETTEKDIPSEAAGADAATPRRTPRRRTAAASTASDQPNNNLAAENYRSKDGNGSQVSRQDAPEAPNAVPATPPAPAPNQSHQPAASALLPPLTRCILTLALFAAAFAPGYAWALLRLAYGARWAATPAPVTLALYAATLPLLAANGVLEACLHGTAGRAALARGNAVLWALSALHLGLLVAATAVLGPAGMLAADAATMALRIFYCAQFARRQLAVAPAWLIPRPGTIAALACAAAVTSLSRVLLLPESAVLWVVFRMPVGLAPVLARISESSLWLRLGLHVAIGAAALAGAGLAALRWERDALGALRRLRRKGAEAVA